MDLYKLSASKLKTYSSCGRKFFYDYVERADSPKHVAAIMGTVAHRTIQQTHIARSLDTEIEPVSELYTRNWHEEMALNTGTMPDAKVYVDGMNIVSAYDFTRRSPHTNELEFRLPFPNAIDPICEIHGFIDQMYDWGLVDLKTSKRKPAPYMLDNDIQFIVYNWAFHRLTGEPANHVLWHHLRTADDIQFDAYSDRLDRATRVIERVIEAYETKTWDRNIGEACMFCSHKQPCLGVANVALHP